MCLQVLILLTLKKFEENRGEGVLRGGGGAVQTLCFGKVGEFQLWNCPELNLLLR